MRIGVDLGGSKIEAIALAPGGVERARLRAPTPRAYEAAIREIAALVAGVEARAGGMAKAVGVGIPGSLSPASGLVRNRLGDSAGVIGAAWPWEEA